MKKYNIKICFQWDDGDDVCEFTIYLPNNINITKFKEILISSHEYLCDDDCNDIYGFNGRNATTLLQYIKEEIIQEMKFEEMKYDLDMEFM